jgi:hypothetical protein
MKIMRIWIRARMARLGIALSASAILFAAAGTSGLTGVNARADALPAPFAKTDTVMTAIESSLAHGEAIALRDVAFANEAPCTAGVVVSPLRHDDGRVLQERRYYYDAACTTLARVETIERIGHATVVTTTTFGHAGTALAKRTTEYTMNAGNAVQTATSRLTAGSGSSVVALANVSWTQRPDGSLDTSVARVEDPQHASIGVVETVRSKAAAGNAVAGETKGLAYRSADGGLAVTLDAPYRVVAADASKIDDASAAWSAQVDSDGLPAQLTVNGTARADGLSLAVKTVNGRFAGRIEGPGGSVAAEFNIDKFGDGLVRFAGGETGTIADWHVLGSAA